MHVYVGVAQSFRLRKGVLQSLEAQPTLPCTVAATTTWKSQVAAQSCRLHKEVPPMSGGLTYAAATMPHRRCCASLLLLVMCRCKAVEENIFFQRESNPARGWR